MVNILAVIVSAVASFIVGSIWFHPRVFGNTWMHLIGKTHEQLKGPKKAMMMVVIPSLVMPIAIGILYNHVDTSSQNTVIGIALLVWLVVICATSSEMIFENRPRKLWVINSIHQLINILVVSYIMALWR